MECFQKGLFYLSLIMAAALLNSRITSVTLAASTQIMADSLSMMTGVKNKLINKIYNANSTRTAIPDQSNQGHLLAVNYIPPPSSKDWKVSSRKWLLNMLAAEFYTLLLEFKKQNTGWPSKDRYLSLT